jgi:hypothetical protein
MPCNHRVRPRRRRAWGASRTATWRRTGSAAEAPTVSLAGVWHPTWVWDRRRDGAGAQQGADQ